MAPRICTPEIQITEFLYRYVVSTDHKSLVIHEAIEPCRFGKMPLTRQLMGKQKEYNKGH